MNEDIAKASTLVLILALAIGLFRADYAGAREPHLEPGPGKLGPTYRIVTDLALPPSEHLVAVVDDGSNTHGVTYLRTSKGETLIRSVMDLRRRVRISSAKQALALARLFSAPETCWLGGYDLSGHYARLLEVFDSTMAPHRTYGVAKGRVINRWTQPVIARHGHRWVISRNLAVAYFEGDEQRQAAIYRSQEVVCTDGTYSISLARRLGFATEAGIKIPSGWR